jgi:hypothetical protein
MSSDNDQRYITSEELSDPAYFGTFLNKLNRYDCALGFI